MVSRIKKISSIFLVSIIAIVIFVVYSQITPETGQNPYQTITEDPSKAITYDICNGSRGCFNEKVTQIVDGDTIYTQNHKVRLSLTNTPEINEAGFNEATAFTEQLCPIGSTITIDQDDLQPIDPYGRILGKVYCGDKILNSELLYNNHANILTQYCVTSEFSFEKWAQEFGCES